MVHVQVILFTSLAASLLAALLAMLGKQWLNRYDSSDMRGSAIERSHNRQRKLDGIVTWYFDYVLESLPLMLQAALLLLGCALSRYLWEVSAPVAYVLLGVTSFGVLFYLFIVIAAAASESCPYQTPASIAFRYLWQRTKIYPIALALVNILEQSNVPAATMRVGYYFHPWWSCVSIAQFLQIWVFRVPFAVASDIFLLGRAVVRELTSLPLRAYRLVCRVYHHLRVTCATQERVIDQQAIVSDLRCVSWTLQTSLDKDIRLSAFQHLATKIQLIYFNPTLVADLSFDVLVGCINISGDKTATMQGKEQLATAAATCFFHSLRHLSVMEPVPNILADIRQRYDSVFPYQSDFTGLPFCHIMAKIHPLAQQFNGHRYIQWDNYRPSSQEYITFARRTVEAAQEEFLQTQCRKVPRWILRFVLHSLALDPLPPAPVVADCLTIIAIDLGCQVSNITALEDRSVHILRVFKLLTRTQVHEWNKSPA